VFSSVFPNTISSLCLKPAILPRAGKICNWWPKTYNGTFVKEMTVNNYIIECVRKEIPNTRAVYRDNINQ